MASVIDTVVNLAKRRGLVYQSGEIYGGTKSAWDYGPLGVELKENIKRQWWRSVVTSRDDVVGLDSSIILPREVWVASGHVEVFNDPLVECLNCHKRHRQDHMQEAVMLHGTAQFSGRFVGKVPGSPFDALFEKPGVRAVDQHGRIVIRL